MTVTLSSRLELPQWSAGTDPFNRAQMNAAFLKLENNAAMDAQDTAANRPSVGKRGRYFFATDTERLSRDTGSAWKDLPSLAAVGNTFLGQQSIVNNVTPQLALDSADATHNVRIQGRRRTVADGSTYRQIVLEMLGNVAALRGRDSTVSGINDDLSFIDGRFAFNWNQDAVVPDLLLIRSRTGTEVARFTESARFGVGVDPSYLTDFRVGTAGTPTMRIGSSTTPDSLIATPVSASQAVLASGAFYNTALSPASTARATSASQFEQVGNAFKFYGDSGLIVGNTYTRSLLATIDPSGFQHKGYAKFGPDSDPVPGYQHGFQSPGSPGGVFGIKMAPSQSGHALAIFDSAANEKFRVENVGQVRATGGSHRFGAGAFGTGTNVLLGDEGDTSAVYFDAESSNVTNVGVTIRAKGTGPISFQRNGVANRGGFDDSGNASSSANETGLFVRHNQVDKRVRAGGTGTGPGGVGRALYVDN